jgi:DNA invertase Pin-like site-specific DNA recombinase
MQDARRRRFDIVVVTKLDRFGRSLRHLVNALAEFDSLGIQFCSFADGIDFSGPYGRAMFGVVSAFSQLERELIVARVKDGLQKARMRGKRLGRPTANFNLDRAVLLAGVGMTYSEIGRTLNVSRMTIARAIRPTEQKPRANSDPASVDTSLTQCPAQKQ